MGYSYNIANSKESHSANNAILGIHALSTITRIFLSTFLVAYIYQFCGDIYQYIFNVSIYNMTAYFSLIVVYMIVSYFVQKTNRIWFYRLALILKAVFVMVVVFYGKNLAQMLVLAGALNGVSDAIYYASYNVIRQEMVGRKSMSHHVVLSYVLTKSVNVVVPIVLGALIDVSSYVQVSMYVFIICIFEILFSFGIKMQRPEGSNYNLRNYLRKMKQNKDFYAKVKLLYFAYIWFGFSTILSVLINVCIMMEMGSNLSLGALTSIFGVVSLIMIMIVSKFTKAGKRSAFLIVLTALYLLSSLVFIIDINLVTIIIYNAGYILLSTVTDTLWFHYRNSNLKEAGLYSEIDEHQTVTELIMNATRIITFGLMLLISVFKSMIAFKILLGVLVGCYCIWAIALVVYEKKFTPKNNEIKESDTVNLQVEDDSDLSQEMENAEPVLQEVAGQDQNQ